MDGMANTFIKNAMDKAKALSFAKTLMETYLEDTLNSHGTLLLDTYQTDPNAFLFSLKSPILQQPEKFKVKDPSHAIYCGSRYGPNFGGGNDLIYTQTQIKTLPRITI